MFYKLLGMAVWKGAKWYLGRRVNTRPLVAGAIVAAVVGGAVVAAKRSSD